MIMKNKILSFVAAFLFSSALLAVEEPTVPEKVNVNTANAEMLDSGLIGVGEKTAMAIVDYREKNGSFVTMEDLMKVNRIGEKTIEKNKDRIVFEE